jgi:FkbM family methyltransferase
LLPSIPSIQGELISEKTYSQYGQDWFLSKLITFLPKKSCYTYVDIGAHDGVTFSNSFFLENLENWNGICVEANDDVFQKLVENRKRSECLNCAISNSIGSELFYKNNGYSEMLSGLANRMPRKHRVRTRKEQDKFSGTTKEVYVETLTLSELCRLRNLAEIDLLLIDVEGAEKAIIESIDFDMLQVNIICVERNFSSNGVLQVLRAAGFLRIIQIGADDIYINSSCLGNDKD